MLCSVVNAGYRQFRNKPGQFAFFVLNDGDRMLDAVLWGVKEGEDYDSYVGKVFEFKGKMKSYNDKEQLDIETITQVDLTTEELEKFIVICPRPLEEMLDQLNKSILKIQDKQLRDFVIYALKSVRDKFITMPGGSQHHHAYLRGLLEHTVQVVDIAITSQETMRVGDKDLVIAGSILHDIGKVYDYEYKGVNFVKTEHGRREGHLVTGHSMIKEFAAKFLEGRKDVEVNEDNSISVSNINYYIDEILHIILSHHGLLEWGSPVKPRTVEAVIVHHSDLISGRVDGFIRWSKVVIK